MKTDNTTFTLWRHPNSCYACTVILNVTHPENLSWSFWVFRLGDPSILHSPITSFTSPSLPKLSWTATSWLQVAPMQFFFPNMENILNLSFHWEDKLIELLCFHPLQCSLSLVLHGTLIQLFCSLSQEYNSFLLGSQMWDHPHHCV